MKKPTISQLKQTLAILLCITLVTSIAVLPTSAIDVANENNGESIEVKFKKVSLGGYHSTAITVCNYGNYVAPAVSAAISEDDFLYTWGNNKLGLLGYSSEYDFSCEPKKILNNIYSVSVGYSHAAALSNDGDLYTWGVNGEGQLGDGSRVDRIVPKKVLSNVSAFSLGYQHSAAVTKDGELYTWGFNNSGQLGDGTKTNQLSPTKVLDNVKSVVINDNHSAAITTDGTLYVWGYNRYGQLGNGTAQDLLVPTKILDNVRSICFGEYVGAAITTNGDLFTWGYNEFGQLGNGSNKNNYNPQKILDNVNSVSLGGWHSSAITENGDLYTWGYNKYGQLGDGTKSNKSTPTKVMENVKAINVGSDNCLAIKENGDLYVWGYNGYGNLYRNNTNTGNNSPQDEILPTRVLDNVDSVSVGDYYKSAITTDGSIYTWGSNFIGQLGDGTTENKSVPTKITVYKEQSISTEPTVPTSDPTNNINDYMIEQVRKYTSSSDYNLYNHIVSMDTSYEVKCRLLNDYFSNYGITNVQEGINYFKDTSSHRLNYNYLTADDCYMAYNYYSWLMSDKGFAARSALYSDGLIFNMEVFDWLNPTNDSLDDYPGAKKNKEMLRQFILNEESSNLSADDVNTALDFMKEILDDNDELFSRVLSYQAGKYLENCMNGVLNAKGKWEIDYWQREFAKTIFNNTDDKIKVRGGKISSYLQGGFIGAKFIVSTTDDLIQLANLSHDIEKYERYSEFLQTIVNEKDISFEMRVAAQSLLDDIEHGYIRKVKSIFDNCCTLAIDVAETAEVLYEIESLSTAIGTLTVGVVVSNIIIDTGSEVKEIAYTLGYAELSTLYSIKLKEDAINFKSNETSENAWQFFKDYTILWELRYQGEQQYLKINSIKSFFFFHIKTKDYTLKEDMVNQTLARLDEAKFEISDEITIPDSVQYVKKSVMNCPVDVDIFTSDGVYITTLKDGVESDITNQYGRFAVVYEPYDGEYTKVICQSTNDDLIIKAKAVDNGIVDFQSISANSKIIESFDKVIVEKNDIIEIGSSKNGAEYYIDRNGDGVIDEISKFVLKDIDTFVPVEKINVSEDSVKLKPGDSYTTKISVTPAESTVPFLTWFSDDDDVVTVKNGVITAVAPGVATVYVKSDDVSDISTSITVTVLDSDKDSNTTKDSDSDKSSDTKKDTDSDKYSDTKKDTDSDKSTDTKKDTDTDKESDKKPTNPDKPKDPIETGTMGDLDGDGKITSADSLLILRQSVSLEHFTDFQQKLADVDGDGKITSADALEVLRYSVSLPTTGNIGKTITK